MRVWGSKVCSTFEASHPHYTLTTVLSTVEQTNVKLLDRDFGKVGANLKVFNVE